MYLDSEANEVAKYVFFNQAPTTVLPGNRKMVTASKSSNTGLIVGLCLGLLAILVCAVVFIYLRRRRNRPK